MNFSRDFRIIQCEGFQIFFEKGIYSGFFKHGKEKKRENWWSQFYADSSDRQCPTL